MFQSLVSFVTFTFDNIGILLTTSVGVAVVVSLVCTSVCVQAHPQELNIRIVKMDVVMFAVFIYLFY
jgi:hypothetical protein